MSITNIAVTKTLPSESKNHQRGSEPKINFVVKHQRDEWTGIKYYDVPMYGKRYRLWEEASLFYVRAEHTGTVRAFTSLLVRNAYMWQLREHLARKAMTALVPVKDVPVRWTITDKAANEANRQRAMDKVYRHSFTPGLTQKDFDTLDAMKKPLPIPSPVSVEDEVEQIMDALIFARDERIGCWNTNAYWRDAPSQFRRAGSIARRYRLREVEEGKVALMNGKKGPRVLIGYIVRPSQRWFLDCTDHARLRSRLRPFVRELYPDLPERVEPVLVEKVPF